MQTLQVERNGLSNWDVYILNKWDVFVSKKSLKTIIFPKKNFATNEKNNVLIFPVDNEYEEVENEKELMRWKLCHWEGTITNI